jgi:N-acetylmuramoyl-L-alanine amidase CwlA
MLISILPSAPRDACLQALEANHWDCDQALSMIFNLDESSIKQLAATWNSLRFQNSSTSNPTTTTTTTTVSSGDSVASTITSTSNSNVSSLSSTTTTKTVTAAKIIDLTSGDIVSVVEAVPKIGDSLRVKLSIDSPVNGWGKVQRGEVGKVIMIEEDTIIVDFPR